MADDHSTRKELLAEVEAARRRLAELESSLDQPLPARNRGRAALDDTPRLNSATRLSPHPDPQIRRTNAHPGECSVSAWHHLQERQPLAGSSLSVVFAQHHAQ